MHRGYVKVWRKIVDGVVFSDPQAFHLFMYLLLKVNHKKGFAYGKELKEGQVLTGRKKLSEATGMSESGVEKVLKRLIKYRLVEQQTFNKYRVVSIVNYHKFNSSEQQSNNKVTTKKQQSNTNNNDKNEKHYKNKYNLGFLDKEFSVVFNEWLDYKKAIKDAYKTQQSVELAYKKLLKLSNNNPTLAREIIEESMANGWKGLFELKKGGNNGKIKSRTRQTFDSAREYIADLEREESNNNSASEVINLAEFGT